MKNSALTKKIINADFCTFPPFMNDYQIYLLEDRGNLSPRTVAMYLNHLEMFFGYLVDSRPGLKSCSAVTTALLGSLTETDMTAYRDHLESSGRSAATVKAHFSALSSLFSYLVSEHVIDSDVTRAVKKPSVVIQKSGMDATLGRKLLSGVLKNTAFLSSGTVLAIPDDVRCRREPLALRNHALIALFLGCGLKLSELSALDLGDVDLRRNTVLIRNERGQIRSVSFDDELCSALSDYINGLPLPEDLVEKYRYKRESDYEWCLSHCHDYNPKRRVDGEYAGESEDFRYDMLRLLSALRRQGRDGLKPDHGENALFISSRGKRMSVRMIQSMIREMAATYIPEHKGPVTPSALRNVCAVNMITESSDLFSVSSQLGLRPSTVLNMM